MDVGNTKVEHTYRLVYDNPGIEPGSVADHWEAEFENLVPDAALNNILSVVYGTTAKSAGFYLMLVTGPGSGNTYAAGDTLASHAGWTEATPYAGNRPQITFPATATSKAISNSGSPVAISTNATATVAGCGIATVNTGTSGLLMGVGNFSTGDKSVSSGGTLTVTVTATAA